MGLLSVHVLTHTPQPTPNKMCDHYIDYLDTYEEALAWYEQVKKA